jgi:hypothetical protein
MGREKGAPASRALAELRSARAPGADIGEVRRGSIPEVAQAVANSTLVSSKRRSRVAIQAALSSAAAMTTVAIAPTRKAIVRTTGMPAVYIT